jgi:hypothetical protein
LPVMAAMMIVAGRHDRMKELTASMPGFVLRVGRDPDHDGNRDRDANMVSVFLRTLRGPFSRLQTFSPRAPTIPSSSESTGSILSNRSCMEACLARILLHEPSKFLRRDTSSGSSTRSAASLGRSHFRRRCPLSFQRERMVCAFSG